MALTFTRAVDVEEGFRPTSSQLKALARAFNDRLRAFSFCPWRIIWYWLNLFRQVRNPAAGLFPAQAEFFHLWQHLDPEHHQGTTWPETGPGEPAGANLANPMMQYIFGIDPSLDAEATRINAGLYGAGAPLVINTLADAWQMGKVQRGAYDPITTAQNTPAFDVAQSHFQVTQPFWSPHGKALGGWLPTPVQLLANCGVTDATGLGIPSYELKFTSLRADVDTTGLHGTITTNPDGTKTVTYAGTCFCGSDNVDVNHVIGYAAWPFAWYIAVVTDPGTCAYAVDRFLVNDWIEGPYEGAAQLAHTEGKQLQRSLWAFHVDFRGTPTQRDPDTFKIKRIAFDNQDFWTRQYALAPNRGQISGDSVEPVYPRATWTATGTVPQGTFGTMQQTGTAEHHYADGFVLAGLYANATKLSSKTKIEVLSGSQLLATLDLVPDVSGNAEAMVWLKVAKKPEPLKMRLGSDASFQPGGTLYAEATEQLEYKPQFWDAEMVSRVSASSGGDPFGHGVDGRGRDDAEAKSITDNFLRYGCLINTVGVRDQAEWVNDNPVFDAARRLSRDHARIIRRQQFVSYEVAGGKSILRFKRFAQYQGIDGVAIRADCFADIAPPLDEVQSGKLIEGETYIVRRSGAINYLGTNYSEGQTFTATSENSFLVHGDAVLYVYDGIRHAAFKKGFTNEWTMFVEPRCYHPSGASIWKPEAYSDYFTFCDRCHFYSATAGGALRRFSTFNHETSLDADYNPVLAPIGLQTQMLNPEVPDSFRYSDGANQPSTTEFYKSCQVYNPPYEIESCVVDDWASEQVIKITLTNRLRSHPNAPATVDPDPTTWSSGDIDALRNTGATPEDYRTDDNAVREYALSEANGNYECIFRTGDAGTGSSVSGLPDNPFGSCYPVFFFGRLIQEPYDDGNDVLESHDSRCLIDSLLHMEIATRSICEGFVDGRTSQDIICRNRVGGLYDYTFENLCFDAFNGRWIGAFSLAERDDGPGGFGPLPSTKMYAEVFNRLVSCVNLLDKVRLDVPIQFMAREFEYRDLVPVTLIDLRGTTCTTSGLAAAYGDHLTAPMATTLVGGFPTAWAPFTIIQAANSAILTGCPYALDAQQRTWEYRVEIDPTYLDAVPAALQELINAGETGFYAERVVVKQNDRRESVDIGSADACAPDVGTFWFTATPEYYRWVLNTDYSLTDCIEVKSGTLVAEATLPSDYKIGRGVGKPAGEFCANSAITGVSLELIADNGAFIKVPIV